MTTLASFAALANFLLIAVGSLVVFRDTGGGRGQAIVTVGFPVLAVLNLVVLFIHQPPFALPGLAMALHLMSAALFAWTAATIGPRRFARAYGLHSSPALVRHGPYRRIRHPFYTSYLLFWLGFGAASPGLVSIATFFAAAFVYNRLAASEERHMGLLYPDYRAYIDATGRFIPFIGRTTDR